MRRFLSITSLGLKLCGTGESGAAEFHQELRPLLETYCYTCHNKDKAKGGVNLAQFDSVQSLVRDPKTWETVVRQLSEGEMPPANKKQPTAEERERLLLGLQHTLDNLDYSALPKNPGRVLLHRLSRTEYNNTLGDLLGVTNRPADKFPADGGGGGGFDNNADTLFVPPILLEKYLAAAEEALEQARPETFITVRSGWLISPRSAARRNIEHFARRAWRRPVEKGEVDRLLGLYDQAPKEGDTFVQGIKLALRAVLVSPNFLFRSEADQASQEPYRVSHYEMASRLSYFIWASMPDAELFTLAEQKKLQDPQVLEAQVLRMLRHPKARALADNFAGQWLGVRSLKTTTQPDLKKFPTFTPSLREAMYEEPVQFFQALLQENGSLIRLLDADYTYANEELGKHYGLTNVVGTELRRVSLSDRNRGGVLGMGGVLTLTSYPQRTSPVLRGKWVLEEILGTPSPPPPPNAGGLPVEDAPKNGLTFRKRLEEHRKRAECASCHKRMDPLGFGLENFDAIGRWRTDVGGEQVDSSGVLTTGEPFKGPAELKQLLLLQKEAFVRNVTEKMFAYALGRGLEYYDVPSVKEVTHDLAKADYRSANLIIGIVKSYPFRYRSNQNPPKETTP